jgi:hypothetical protein
MGATVDTMVELLDKQVSMDDDDKESCQEIFDPRFFFIKTSVLSP